MNVDELARVKLEIAKEIYVGKLEGCNADEEIAKEYSRLAIMCADVFATEWRKANPNKSIPASSYIKQ